MRLGSIVLDSNNIEELSNFYAKILGWTKNVQMHDGEMWITLVREDYSEVPLVFQDNPDYIKPTWPSKKDSQQQMVHFDFYVRMNEYESKIDYVVSCGATVSEIQESNDWTVMLDLAGHPFCIIPIPNEVYEQRY